MSVFELEYFWILAATSLITATVSASVGFLGGTILLMVMAQFLPAAVLIPLHGVIQLWSNSSRALILHKSINWRIAGFYALGTIFGSLLASQYVMRVPEPVYNVGLGILVLTLTLVPKEVWSRPFKARRQLVDKWLLTGFFSSFIGLFVGAIGVLVGAVFMTEKDLDKKMMVATQAICQSLVHLSKILVFVYLGFELGPWMGLFLALIVMTIIGTYLGTRLLDRIPQALFLRIFRTLIIVLAIRLILVGLNHFVG